ELRGALPEELWNELDKLTPDIRDGTLEELSLAQAEILGWLEGLFQGTHLALQAQAAQAAQMLRQQMADAERGELARGASDGEQDHRDLNEPPGNTTQYL
ncbi:MAG: bacterial proteasome activator family protein, partial [Actinobacteria bacterium]|nr:bacterial proteasome activator family protein [Actinomycetota bacterium]